MKKVSLITIALTAACAFGYAKSSAKHVTGINMENIAFKADTLPGKKKKTPGQVTPNTAPVALPRSTRVILTQTVRIQTR